MCFAGVLSKANYKCVQYTRIYHTGPLLSVLLPDEGSDSQKAFQVQLDIEHAYLTQEKSPGCQSNPNPFPPLTMCCPTFVCLLLLTRYSSKRGCKRQELIGEGAENRHLSLLLFSALWISHGCNSVHSIEPSLVLHREGGGKKKRWEKDGEVSRRVRRDERIMGNKWRRSGGDEWLENWSTYFYYMKTVAVQKTPKTKQNFFGNQWKNTCIITNRLMFFYLIKHDINANVI